MAAAISDWLAAKAKDVDEPYYVAAFDATRENSDGSRGAVLAATGSGQLPANATRDQLRSLHLFPQWPQGGSARCVEGNVTAPRFPWIRRQTLELFP